MLQHQSLQQQRLQSSTPKQGWDLLTPKEKPSRMQIQHKEIAALPPLYTLLLPSSILSTRGLQKQLEMSNRMARSPLPRPIIAKPSSSAQTWGQFLGPALSKRSPQVGTPH